MKNFFQSDLFYSFRKSPITILAFLITVLIIVTATFANIFAPHNPFDLATLDLMNASIPPAWYPDGNKDFFLGTDNQGRDILSAILYGTRISLLVAAASVVFSMIIGVFLGLLSGYLGGTVDNIIMRCAEVQLTFPAILVVLLIDGVLRAVLPRDAHDNLALYVIVFSIGLSGWVQFARTVRSSTLVEKSKEYVQAAKVIGRSSIFIMIRHILPNVMNPVLVIATINLGLAILTESTLSFLGVGLPPTEPSLGTLIHVGQDFLLSGEWWMSILPGAALAALVLSVNLLGDWLRDALNPKLR